MHPDGLVAQWITRLTTDQKIPGSNPGKLELFSSFLMYKLPVSGVLIVAVALDTTCLCSELYNAYK